MTTRRKWTDEEEQVLISQVRKNPNNLSRAFRATSDSIGRSSHSVEQHWYTKTRHLEPVFIPMPKVKYILVEWPESQMLMEHERFNECLLVCDIEGHNEVGSSAYMCPEDLFEEIYERV